MTTLTGLVTVAAAVLTMIWMFRVAKNHRTLHRGGTWGPGWAIGGWFLPPIIYVIPTLMLREIWKASDPSIPVGGDWKSRPASPLPLVWLIVYCVPPLISFGYDSDDLVDQFGASERVLAEQIAGSQGVDVLLAVASVVAAGLFIDDRPPDHQPSPAADRRSDDALSPPDGQAVPRASRQGR